MMFTTNNRNCIQSSLMEKLFLTTSRGCSPAVRMCRGHSSAVTPFALPATQGTPEHCAPAQRPLCSVCRPPRLPPKQHKHTLSIHEKYMCNMRHIFSYTTWTNIITIIIKISQIINVKRSKNNVPCWSLQLQQL